MPDRPIVLIATPGGEPKRAELWNPDASTTTAQVVYCDGRRSAYVAKSRILGPADNPATPAGPTPVRGTYREHGNPTTGLFFGTGRQPGDGQPVTFNRYGSALDILATDGTRIVNVGHTAKFWYATASLPETTEEETTHA